MEMGIHLLTHSTIHLHPTLIEVNHSTLEDTNLGVARALFDS